MSAFDKPAAAQAPLRCYALVPCAGVGERAGAGLPKQYAPLAGKPLVRHTLQALRQCPAVAHTLVVVSPRDDWFERLVPAHEHSRQWLAPVGGATRAQSVAAGLRALRERGATDADWVLVHDAARCLLQPAWVERLVTACAGDAVGGLLALPVADTLKRAAAGDEPRVAATVPRSGLWAAQTPQMFRLGLLDTALQRAGDQVTDEASALEAMGHAPLLVTGDWRNLKITWPADFELAEALFASQPNA